MTRYLPFFGALILLTYGDATRSCAEDLSFEAGAKRHLKRVRRPGRGPQSGPQAGFRPAAAER